MNSPDRKDEDVSEDEEITPPPPPVIPPLAPPVQSAPTNPVPIPLNDPRRLGKRTQAQG